MLVFTTRLMLMSLLMCSCAHVHDHVTIDVGTEYYPGEDPLPIAGLSYTVWYCSLSVGMWTTMDGERGPYQGVGCSFPVPFTKSKKKAKMIAKNRDPLTAGAYHGYKRGWLAGSSARQADGVFTNHKDLTMKEEYERGYSDGREAANKAMTGASERIGHKPSVLRVKAP